MKLMYIVSSIGVCLMLNAESAKQLIESQNRVSKELQKAQNLLAINEDKFGRAQQIVDPVTKQVVIENLQAEKKMLLQNGKRFKDLLKLLDKRITRAQKTEQVPKQSKTIKERLQKYFPALQSSNETNQQKPSFINRILRRSK